MSIASGQDIDPADFVSSSAGAGDSGKVPKLAADGKLDQTFFRDKIIRTYTATTSSNIGATGTRFDISNPSGTTFRYTWDGTGTDPVINTTTFPVGAYVWIRVSSFNLANQGVFAVTASGTNYFEITNAPGVIENDKTLSYGADFFKVHTGTTSTWTKPSGLKYIEVEVQGGGGGSYGWDTDASYAALGGGGGGGYSKKYILASTLGATETVIVGIGGLCGKNAATPLTGFNGLSSSFGTHCYGNGGAVGSSTTTGGIGGTATGGDININGSQGSRSINQGTSPRTIVSGNGGDSKLGFGGRGVLSNENGNDGQLYGGGASGICDNANVLSVGANGIVIVTEYY